MKVIRNCPEARWLPSRSHFAIFRLASFIRMRYAGRPTDGAVRTMVVIDRYQNAFEHFSVAALVMLVTIIDLAQLFSRWLVWPAAFVIAVIAAQAVVEIPLYLAGLVLVPLGRRVFRRPGENNISPNSAVYMGVVLLVSAWVATLRGAAAALAMAVLALAGLNAIAACVMWMLRGRVREAEARCGV